MEYLEGWELVPAHNDGGREQISSTKHGCAEPESQSELEEVLFPSPSPSPISPRLDTEMPTEKQEEEEEIPTPTIIAEAMEAEDPDPVSLISFDNTKETEFVDMKSPESKSKAFIEEEEEEEEVVDDDDDQVAKDSEETNGGCGGGFDLWKWSWGLTGIGALVFIVVLGAATGPGVQHKNTMGFKGYEENQRLKEMVSAVRGGSVPLTRAHITFGGYYDAPSLNH